MTPLSDDTIRRLRDVVDAPELPGSRYDNVQFVARGGMGVVFRAHDRDLGREVAVKVLSTAGADDDTRARLLTEARILARLEHPGIVPVHDAGALPDGRVFYTMKLVRGSRLDEYAAGADDRNDLLRVFLRVCEAVAFAHAQGVVHRDLKPGNVMVGAFGEVLVMDWGVAKILSGASEPVPPSATSPSRADTATGSILGTPGFMPPEQARGDSARVDARSDVYSLGALLGLLAETGVEPSPVPRRLGAIIARATSPDPAGRYPGVEALSADVIHFMTGGAVDAYREPWYERAARVAGRHRTALALVLAYLLMRILVFLANRL